MQTSSRDHIENRSKNGIEEALQKHHEEKLKADELPVTELMVNQPNRQSRSDTQIGCEKVNTQNALKEKKKVPVRCAGASSDFKNALNFVRSLKTSGLSVDGVRSDFLSGW